MAETRLLREYKPVRVCSSWEQPGSPLGSEDFCVGHLGPCRHGVVFEWPSKELRRERPSLQARMPFYCLHALFLLWAVPLRPREMQRDLCQEPREGGFSKGGFCRVQCHAPGNKKYPRILGPSVRLALRAPQPRKAHIFAKTPF